MINQQKLQAGNKTEQNYLAIIGSNKKVITKIFNLNQLRNKYKEQKQDFQVNDKIGNLFIGGTKILTDQILSKHKIKALLTVLDYKTYQKLNLQEKILDLDSVFKHFFVDMCNDQNEDITVYAKNSYNFIEESLPYTNVLIHCSDGLCRSPVIVISYLMKRFNLDYNEAYKLIQNENNLIKIKPGFQTQLINFNKATTTQQKIVIQENSVQVQQSTKLEQTIKNSQQKEQQK